MAARQSPAARWGSSVTTRWPGHAEHDGDLACQRGTESPQVRGVDLGHRYARGVGQRGRGLLLDGHSALVSQGRSSSPIGIAKATQRVCSRAGS
jgi:hypothetical protein